MAALCVFIGAPAFSATTSTPATPRVAPAVRAELDRLAEIVPRWRIVKLPGGPGLTTLSREHSLTIDDLRGLVIDENPPVLGRTVPPYDAHHVDCFAPGAGPYVAEGVGPFRFKYFNCKFNYLGRHNNKMADYASTRGFNIICPAGRKTEHGRHLPAGTRWIHWGVFIKWPQWMRQHRIEAGHYHKLKGLDLVSLHVRSGRFQKTPRWGDALMIDMEHRALSPEKLRRQPWYPRDASEALKKAFEKDYYDGYAQTYISSVKAARVERWKAISIYGWAPSRPNWWELERTTGEPDHVAWNDYGKQIYEVVDIINDSVYCYYWRPKNVAYTLENIDRNMALVQASANPKPVRPYYWPLLHGGGWRWWRYQPMANEEARAMIAMGFFTGFEGFVLWNTSGKGSHHRRPKVDRRWLLSAGERVEQEKRYGRDLMLNDGFTLAPQGAAAGRTREIFRRYDVIHVTDVDEAGRIVRFRKIRPQAPNNGLADTYPLFAHARLRTAGAHQGAVTDCGRHDRRHAAGQAAGVCSASWESDD